MLQLTNRAVFLDRDGTLNQDPGYLREPSQVHLFPGVGEALRRLKDAGFLLIVISNQSGVGRGLIDPEQIPKIHRQLDALIGVCGVKIDYYGLCFHRPDQNCECRKPKPKLLLDAMKALRINPTMSYMIGDRLSDVFAGQAAGCRGSFLVDYSQEGLHLSDIVQKILLDQKTE